MALWSRSRDTPRGQADDGLLMKTYCEWQGLSMRQIRFRFDVQPSSEAGTPAQLEVEDQDSITCSSSRQETRRSLAASWDVVSRGTGPTLPPSMHLDACVVNVLFQPRRGPYPRY